MKSNYEERKQNRIEAFQNLAAKNEELSNSAYEHSRKLADVIPFGQPILVGHHSERGHRSHLKKINSAMGKSVEAAKKAKYYEERAESLLNGTAISSDNPNAIELLRAKLSNLEALQTLYKEINKVIKSKSADKIAGLVALGISEARAAQLLAPDFCGRIGVPSYKLTNNNGVMSNVKKRIAQLENIAKLETSEEIINGVTLRVNVEDNRVQMLFGAKPSEEIRTQIKKAGFVFSYQTEAWQRKISNWAIYEAKTILNGLIK